MSNGSGESYYEAQTSHMERLLEAEQVIMDQGGADIDPEDFDPEDELDSAPDAHAALVKAGHISDDDTVSEDDVREWMDDYALSIDIHKVYRVWLTLGGPNAGIDVTTRDGLIERMEYFYRGGNEKFDKSLSEHSALGRYAAEQVERMMEIEVH